MISFVICANSNWIDHASKAIASILYYEPATDCVLVDNGSDIPYLSSEFYKLVRRAKTEHYGYTAALNEGAGQAVGDWLFFCNDDILCTGQFAEMVHSLSPKKVYGAELRHKSKDWGLEFDYLYGWFLLMHRSLFEKVGPFEEYYLHAGFDDLDYCWRAQQAGYKLEVLKLPFLHLADHPGFVHRRMEVPGFQENMRRNKEFFLAKARGEE